MANIQAESERILQEAHLKQSEIIKEANATREEIINEAKSKASSEGIRILNDARKQIEAEKTKARNESKADVIDLSIKIAEKVLAKDLEKDARQKEWINNLLDGTTEKQ